MKFKTERQKNITNVISRYFLTMVHYSIGWRSAGGCALFISNILFHWNGLLSWLVQFIGWVRLGAGVMAGGICGFS